ncbi:hypothetical protein [Rhodopirellula bahusiensis]|uniref:hypothetical protein n=1 Tax=Rhodopirellula bahusiensis TaxID=2014065 RepID=UPI003263397C
MGHSKLELVLGSKQVLARSKLELEQVRSKRLVLELARSKQALGLVRSKLVLVLRSKLELVRSSFSF